MNRTKIGVVSAVVVVAEALIVGVLTMIRTKYVLIGYGTNINGVMQLATQLTAYMLLFESGMTAAYQYNMYKPLIDRDKNKITALFKGMKYDFKYISLKMAICVIVVALFYSVILKNRGVTYIQAASLLFIMGMRIVAPYFFTVPLRTLLIVNERKYLTDVIETIKNTISLIIEVLLIKYTSLPLAIILSIFIILTYMCRIPYQHFVRKYYGAFSNKVSEDRSPKTMTNDILVHRIAGMINSNTDSVLLSLFKNLGLNSVTIYSSFNTLISYPVTLVTRIVDSLRASVAIKIYEDLEHSYDYYRELMVFSKVCCLIVFPIFITQANDFVSLWIGKEYNVRQIDLILFSLTGAHQILMPSIYAVRDAKGLYKESKKYSLYQAAANIIISLALIIPFGITGVLLGTVISDWIILEPFNIYLTFKKVFNKKFDMTLDYLGLLLMFALLSFLGDGLNIFFSRYALSWSVLFLKALLSTVVVSLISVMYLLFTDCYSKNFFRRFVHRR